MNKRKDNRNFSNHYVILILAGGAVVIGVLLLLFWFTPWLGRAHQKKVPEPIYNKTLTAGALTIPVSVADTPASQEQGLSGTSALPASSGKLFVFNQPGNYGFWMKDMEYSLDFVWMDSAMKITAITPHVAADTYPEIFYSPQKPVQYVLEVNAGFSAAHTLTVGEQFTLH